MEDMKMKTCIPCEGSFPPLQADQLETLHKHVPDWEIIEVDGEFRLKRTFTFRDFKGALSFTNAIGEIAEEQGHHPVIELTWGRVTVQWWTHKINGLHENDFIMAAKTDQLI